MFPLTCWRPGAFLKTKLRNRFAEISEPTFRSAPRPEAPTFGRARGLLSECIAGLAIFCAIAFPNVPAFGSDQSSPTIHTAEKVIIDTDIGDDIDDAFAVALALRSPELQILGITTTFGDTETRARLLDRFLGEAGRQDIVIAAGAPTETANPMSQRRYAEAGRFAKASHPAAVDYILSQIQKYPNQLTLIAIGPLMNLGALIDRDKEAFHKLKRIVLMGGSIERGYDALPYGPPHPPEPEWNIVNDIASAQKLFASGVPIYVMPLDSTQLKLDEIKRAFLFQQGTPITDSLTLLYHQWGQQTPTLFDPMAVGYAVDPTLCPVHPMRIRVDEKGFTRVEAGTSNAYVCLHSDPEAFFRFYMNRVAAH
jgi:purine nucleosidase